MTSNALPDPPSAPSGLPARFVNVEAARRVYGGRVDTLGAFLSKTDPLAEAVVAAFSELAPGKGKKLLDQALDEGIGAVPSAPKALVRLFEAIEAVPFWVDREQLDLGGATLLRCGFLGLSVLAAGSLPLSYLASGGNKALTFSRRLVEMAPRRLVDTMRFHLETCLPGGLERGSEGFKTTIRVRLVHAQMRRILWASGRWDAAAWGAPLNQSDTAGTNVLFSAYPLRWLRRLGYHFTPEESDAVVQLWRYSGHLLGIDPVLLSATEAEAHRLGAIVEATWGPPDDDSRALIHALRGAMAGLMAARFPKSPTSPFLPKPALASEFWSTLTRFCLGDAVLDQLGIPKSPARVLLPVMRAAVAQGEALRRRSPRGTELALRMGTELERYFVSTAMPSQQGTIEAVLGAQGRRRGEENRRS